PQKLQAMVLAGGYGRGEGGVLKTDQGDQPYNDLEFYLLLDGNRLLNERRYQQSLHQLSASLSPSAGLQVEFKIDSLPRLRRRSISMFAHLLLYAVRLLFVC